ncbi:MAG: thiamine pyrophosphate-dependent enzyme [Bryobacteraceae bacterium]|jgi:thiamine pyrophosphate-dependent acetolactate synthase large subunit-like protein
MANSRKNSVGRRGFLKGAAGAAALLAETPGAIAQKSGPPPTRVAAAPDAVAATENRGTVPSADVLVNERPGSDFMVDVIKSLGFEYCCANPGSAFRALHESIINYGGNSAPELITCCHEESAVAMAHGFAKIEGKPLMVMAHGTVGLQHASMAIYNAYADRVPIYIVLGNILDETYRRGYSEWFHSVQDAASLVRDFTKWDDTPVSLAHFADSAVRAYQVSMTPPQEPVVLVADAKLQEEPISESNLRIPKLTIAGPPQGDSGSVAEAAKLLVAAENPLIVAGRLARTPKGIELLVELAETLQAPVEDQRHRMNFPSRHPLYGAGSVKNADVILALEVQDVWSLTHDQTPVNRFGMEAKSIARPGTKVITVSALDLNFKSNYQDFQRYTEADLVIAADAEATLPSLIEAVKRLLTDDRKRFFKERGVKLAEAGQRVRDRNRQNATLGWNSSPISTARLSAEIWGQIRNEDWSLVSNVNLFLSAWPTRLWDFDKHYQYIGAQGAAGIGYGAPAAVGAALANKKHGRLSVNIQCDGDLNYAPGVLWTAAHHRIPLLTIMHNNRGYHQELMQVQTMANRANRGIDRAQIGTTITDPNIDYAKMAQTYGMYGAGPISDPQDLAPALKRAIEIVKRGEPALIDVVTQPR